MKEICVNDTQPHCKLFTKSYLNVFILDCHMLETHVLKKITAKVFEKKRIGAFVSSSSIIASFLLLIYLHIYFWPCLGLHCLRDFSLAVANRSYSPVEVHGLLTAVDFLVAEHGL